MTKPAELKGSTFTLSALHLCDEDIQKAIDVLKEKVTQAPTFFASAPIVINIAKVESQIDFNQLKAGIEEAGMIPVGVSGSKDTSTQEQAKAAGLAIMTEARQAKAPEKQTKAEDTAEPIVIAEATMEPTKIIHTPVRSGQQIYAKNCDLVIMNHVSPGAEIIADGSIHVYGTLRGRAIAGASGQQQARIFCQNLQPELVSIAGNYWLSDKIPNEQWGKAVVISLADNNLNIKLLAL